jgi:hypothetical protein
MHFFKATMNKLKETMNLPWSENCASSSNHAWENSSARATIYSPLIRWLGGSVSTSTKE